MSFRGINKWSKICFLLSNIKSNPFLPERRLSRRRPLQELRKGQLGVTEHHVTYRHEWMSMSPLLTLTELIQMLIQYVECVREKNTQLAPLSFPSLHKTSSSPRAHSKQSETREKTELVTDTKSVAHQ